MRHWIKCLTISVHTSMQCSRRLCQSCMTESKAIVVDFFGVKPYWSSDIGRMLLRQDNKLLAICHSSILEHTDGRGDWSIVGWISSIFGHGDWDHSGSFPSSRHFTSPDWHIEKLCEDGSNTGSSMFEHHAWDAVRPTCPWCIEVRQHLQHFILRTK